MTEEWKFIEGYDGHYSVSNLGRVRSNRRFRTGKCGCLVPVVERIMKQQTAKTGYIQVCLCYEGKKILPLVHRLVALAFLPNKKNLPCVDHIDGNRANNVVNNLRWCTYEENLGFDLARNNISASAQNSEKHQLHIRQIASECQKPIVIVFPDGTEKFYPSAAAAEKDGFNHSLIAACCKGKQKTHRKCRCYYKENYEIQAQTISARGGKCSR